jgi:hypothetical protein
LVASVYWTSSGEGVYFFTQEALYWAAAPEFTPSHLMDAPDHDLYFKAWVQP